MFYWLMRFSYTVYECYTGIRSTDSGGADPWYGYRTVRKCDHDPQTSESLINNEREIKMPSPKVIGNNTKGDAAGKRQPPLYMNEFLQKLRNCRRRQ